MKHGDNLNLLKVIFLCGEFILFVGGSLYFNYGDGSSWLWQWCLYQEKDLVYGKLRGLWRYNIPYVRTTMRCALHKFDMAITWTIAHKMPYLSWGVMASTAYHTCRYSNYLQDLQHVSQPNWASISAGTVNVMWCFPGSFCQRCIWLEMCQVIC